MSKLPRPGGNLYGHNSTATPIKEPSYGKSPVVGQGGKAYVSGQNAHGQHQAKTKAPAPGSKSGHTAASKPKQSHY